ncbi:putative disease resistance RPP13-like protein 1 [Carex rostrata]
MTGIIASGIKWTTEKLSSLLTSAAYAAQETNETQNASVLEDLRKLERTMRRIQSILMDAGERDVEEHAEKLRLKELKEVAYDAEDVVGDYEYDVLHAKIQVRNRMLLGIDGSSGLKRKRQGEVLDLHSIAVIVPVSDEIASRVKEITGRFEETTQVWDTLKWDYSLSSMHQGLNMPTKRLTRQPSSSLVQEATIYGRDEDKENIIKQLIFNQDGGSREGKLKVHTIVGMGGIGKTTLAQLVYNDARVRERFELKGWVCVSDDFDVVTLTRKIITSFTKKNCDFCELDDVQSNLQEEVIGKSFILVLDDVWNEEQSLWDSLLLPLQFSRSGTILVTSRSAVVAKVVQMRPPYTLDYLNFEACCSLFKQLVFCFRERDIDGPMMQVAERIVAKCNGLPLAVKAIGSVCRIEYDVNCWMEILESKELKPNIRDGDCFLILKLSYDRMLPPLKQCFAFLSLFPKDHVFHADKIIKLWMSVGLINGSNRKMLEDIGREYINHLLERSMIQRIENRDVEPEQFFAMHDLLHDLAELVSDNEVARRKLEMTETRIAKKFDMSEASTVRYLSIVPSQEDPDCIKQNKTLMDMLQHFQGSRIMRLVQVLTWENHATVRVEIPINMLETWKHIRALDFSHAAIITLPESIGNLKLLRYLNVSGTELEFLPKSTFSLYNLQTLEFDHCPLKKLPNGIGQLVNLRHLNNDSEYPCCLPYGIGLLTNLQSLKTFVIGKNSSECNIGELKNLAFLSGSLSIFGLNNVSDIEDAKEVNLHKKGYIEQLILNFRCNSEFDINDQEPIGISREFSETLLEILEPNKNLTELQIFNYNGTRFPRWVSDKSFCKLVKVKLAAFRCELLPPLGQLPSLKYLQIHWAYNVHQIGHEFFGVDTIPEGSQSLDRIETEKMPISTDPQLVALPSTRFTTLTTLVLMDCIKLSRILTLPSLSHLGLFGKFHEMILLNSHLPKLKTIVVSWSHEVTKLDFNNQNVRLLEALNIYGCACLESIDGLAKLTSLKQLTITMCPQLKINPEEDFPPSLDRYEVRGCHDIDYMSKDYRPGNELADDDLGVRINMMSLN